MGVFVVPAGASVTAALGGGAAVNSFLIGNGAGAQGDLKVTGGLLTTTQRLTLGGGNGAYAGFSIDSGTVTIGGTGSTGNPEFLIGNGTGDRKRL